MQWEVWIDMICNSTRQHRRPTCLKPFFSVQGRGFFFLQPLTQGYSKHFGDIVRKNCKGFFFIYLNYFLWEFCVYTLAWQIAQLMDDYVNKKNPFYGKYELSEDNVFHFSIQALKMITQVFSKFRDPFSRVVAIFSVYLLLKPLLLGMILRLGLLWLNF